MNWTTRLLTTEEAGAIADAWRALLDRRPGATVFNGPDFLLPLIRAFPEGVRGVLALEDGAGTLEGVMPVALLRLATPLGTLREAGFPETAHSLRNTPLLPPGDPGAVRALLAGLRAACPEADTVRLSNLPEGDAMAVAPGGMRETSEGRRLFHVDLSTGFDAWFETCGRRLKRDFRQANARCGKAGRLDVRRYDGAQIEGALADWEEIVARSWQGQEGTRFASGPADWALHRGLARNGHLFVLHLKGRPVALTRLLRHGSTGYLHVQHYDQSHAELKPGYYLTEHVLRAAVGLGMTRIDLHGGNELFERMGNGATEHVSVRLYRATPRGVVIGTLAGAVRAYRSWTSARRSEVAVRTA